MFLRSLIALIIVATCATVSAAKTAKQPNVLLCIADDWGWHAGAYGDPVVKTPIFDRVAREGILFRNAFVASPSCTPSRGALLTGRPIHQLKEGGNLWSSLSTKFKTYPDLLEENGYFIGLTRKGWSPGNVQAGGRTRNPAGPNFKDFASFLEARPKDKPFCFWFGSQDPHRPYVLDSGLNNKNIRDVKVPPCWPDVAQVRGDILDYYFEVERFDREVGELLETLQRAGELDNTIVIITSDNGAPFPRHKANLYDGGTRVPLAIRWPAGFKATNPREDFVSLADLAPTILEAVGLKPLAEMTGRSVLPLAFGKSQPGRDRVFLERERHANVRQGDASYPSRAIRTKDFLYIWNVEPELWPAGDPQLYHSVGPYGDVDDGPTKQFILASKDSASGKKFFDWSFAKRLGEELYDLRKDPHQLNNVAGKKEYARDQELLAKQLLAWMQQTGDPRATSEEDPWSEYPYYGPPVRAAGTSR